jgi:hypothetical protein
MSLESIIDNAIQYLTVEKKINCQNVTTIINENNFNYHRKSQDVIKYFFWTKANGYIFEVYDSTKNSCFFLYRENYIIIEKCFAFDEKTKRILDHLINSCSCMICQIDDSHKDIFACHNCQYLMCYDCLGKMLIQKFQETGDRTEKCPQCRIVMKNMPLKLIYVNKEFPELSDNLTLEEQKAIDNTDKILAKRNKNKIRKLKKKMKQTQEKLDVLNIVSLSIDKQNN